jgi:chemotaxis methyl-accepting protein methylase
MKTTVQIHRLILDQVIQRIADDAGIDPASLELGRIAWTIQRRCRVLAISDPRDYLAHLQSSGTELDQLIDALVIQETRFFRDLQVFDQLRLWARETASRSAEPLRILSAPCSTGQEAYSVAAVLHSAGIPFPGFSIDAFDISPSALAVAQRGVYPAGALDHVPQELRAACGTLRNQHWEMREELRGRIRFDRRNLSQPGALATAPRYHLILCRNLFIYLGAPARAVLAHMLSQALLPGGRLVVGAGDRVAELNALFTSLKPASSFGLIHKPVHRIPVAVSFTAVQPLQLRTPRLESPSIIPGIAVQTETAVEFYRRAVECMERGNARQAERRCRQALYLAPSYLPALEMLQSLWHVHPNVRIQRALSARIQRVRAESEPRLAAKRLQEGGTA